MHICRNESVRSQTGNMLVILHILAILHISLITSSLEHSNSVSQHIDFSQLEDEVITKNVHQSVGLDVALKCKENERFRTHAFRWKFAKCAHCEDVDPTALHWTDISSMRRTLHLRNVTIGDSGRYICIDNTISTSYNLQVSSNVRPTERNSKNFTFQGRPPVISSIVKSDVITEHSTVLVKCNVSSPIAPLFRWLKQCDGMEKCDFKYAGNYYNKLKVSSHNIMRGMDDDYVSKLRMVNFTSADNGVYVCFTMTMLGKAYQHFTLAVSEEENDQRSASLNLLFLIPAVFILVPICIDCIGKRICGRRKTGKPDVVLLQVLNGRG